MTSDVLDELLWGFVESNLTGDDEVIGMQLDSQGEALLIVSANGMGKRTLTSEFTTQHRGGKGIKCYKITEKTGDVVRCEGCE